MNNIEETIDADRHLLSYPKDMIHMTTPYISHTIPHTYPLSTLPSVSHFVDDVIHILMTEENKSESRAVTAVNKFILAVNKLYEPGVNGYGRLPMEKLKEEGGRITTVREGKPIPFLQWIKRTHPFFTVIDKGSRHTGVTEVRLHYSMDKDELVRLDVVSLSNFMKHLMMPIGEMTYYPNANELMKEAKTRYQYAIANGGYFPMQYEWSPYGRKYYKGINLQSCSKVTRLAALGTCYEFDLVKAAHSYKYWLWERHLRHHIICDSDHLPCTKQYLEQDMIKLCLDDIANTSEDWAMHYRKSIKQAFTAIAFGGRGLSKDVWFDGKTLAVNKIIPDDKLRDKFLNWQLGDFSIPKLIKEQTQLSKLAVEHVKQQRIPVPDYAPSRVMAYLYQHAETELMNEVINYIRHHELGFLYHVHDAIYVKAMKPNTLADLNEIALRHWPPYGKFEVKAHHGF